MSGKKALLIYVEPTPYILDLVSILNQLWPAGVTVLFVKENASQAWSLQLKHRYLSLLTEGLINSLREIQSHFASKDYGIVHLAGWAPPLMPCAMLLARYRRIPVSVETDTPLPATLPLWKRAAKRFLYPLLFSLPQVFLPGGKRQADYLRYYGVPKKHIVNANMTVDVTSISRHVDRVNSTGREHARLALGLSAEATVFLYVGRMEPYKGLRELLEAFGQLPASGPSVALLLVGDGSMRDFLERAVAADPRIYWLGRLTGAHLLGAYAAADIFVLASHFEPWGLVVNEAMAAGLPVIATERVGCVDDLVTDGETGRVVPAESAEALAVAMNSLLVDGQLRSAMARRARALIAGWTLENEANIIVNTWTQLLER